MKILRNLQVPTGNILVVQGEKGPLEVVSLGDYGKDVNLKADFLGLTRDITHVDHQEMLPLTEKWVVTVSTQYGCREACNFCDAPLVGKGENASVADLLGQIQAGLSIHPEITSTNRLNIHFARMGEPTYNSSVLTLCDEVIPSKYGKDWNVHPVVSTMMPSNNEGLESFLLKWMQIKNERYQGNAGLQLSINSTSSISRSVMFRHRSLPLQAISEMMSRVLQRTGVRGRKITLNFALSSNWYIDTDRLVRLFDPDNFLIKLTPMHETNAANRNQLHTNIADYSMYEDSLKAAGFDVIVFIASREEDLGRITCGNAILSGTLPEVEYKELEV